MALLKNEFKRCDGFVGNVPQNFVDSNVPNCPLCGSGEPYWTLRDKMELKGTRVQFRCKDCGCILSATQEDFTGKTKSTAHALFSSAGAINAIIKKRDGKDIKTVYIHQHTKKFIKILPFHKFKSEILINSIKFLILIIFVRRDVEGAVPYAHIGYVLIQIFKVGKLLWFYWDKVICRAASTGETRKTKTNNCPVCLV